MLPRRLIGLTILVFACQAHAEDQKEVRDWLDRMARAVETLDYRGTMVYWRDGRVDTLRIVHRADDEGIRERIYSLDGPPREILREGDRVRCLFPDDQAVVVQSRLAARLIPNLPLNRKGNPAAGYNFRLAGEDRVAGMATRIVEILPRDEYRYGHRFWLEKRTGMLLRSALLDDNDEILQQLTFTDIELGARIHDAELEPTTVVAGSDSATTGLTPSEARVGQAPDEASWRPAELPPGFQLTAVERGSEQGRGQFEHLLFSDGLASFSVYIESRDETESEGSGLEMLGPVHVYTRRHKDLMFTVVGEVPAKTVREIGRQFLRSTTALRHLE